MGSSETGGCFDCVFGRMPPAKYAAGLRQTAEGGDVVSAVWKGKRDYAIKPLRRPTAGGRGVWGWAVLPEWKGDFLHCHASGVYVS